MKRGQIFFRMDDLGWHHDRFVQAAKLFANSHQKLNVAAIPLNCLENFTTNPLIAWTEHIQVHTHGYAHLDHQNAGKKAEFGSQRRKEGVLRDLQKGQKILAELFGAQFFEAFTPPWNRMDKEFFPLLVQTGYAVLSRDGDKSSATPKLVDLNVHIDVHTRKGSARHTLSELLNEIERMRQGQDLVGIMLHHKFMTPDDFKFLGQLLTEFDASEIRTPFYSELYKAQREPSK